MTDTELIDPVRIRVTCAIWLLIFCPGAIHISPFSKTRLTYSACVEENFVFDYSKLFTLFVLCALSTDGAGISKSGFSGKTSCISLSFLLTYYC